jgi:hypothetical protein
VRFNYCVFEYQYRDAGNWKTHGALRLIGDARGARESIRDCLESGELFVSEQVSIPSLCRQHWEDCKDGPSALDHAYHEFMDLRPATADDAENLPIFGKLDALLAQFRSAAERWDVSLSPNCFL